MAAVENECHNGGEDLRGAMPQWKPVQIIYWRGGAQHHQFARPHAPADSADMDLDHHRPHPPSSFPRPSQPTMPGGRGLVEVLGPCQALAKTLDSRKHVTGSGISMSLGPTRRCFSFPFQVDWRLPAAKPTQNFGKVERVRKLFYFLS